MRVDFIKSFCVKAISILPQNLLSWVVGQLFALPLPSFLIKYLAFGFGINLDEAEKPLADYPTFGDLFARRLKAGLRPLCDPLIVACDGRLVSTVRVNYEQALVVKGQSFHPQRLVTGGLDLGWVAPELVTTIYLAPCHYHRVHVPLGAVLKEIVHLPGYLWPVNKWGLGWIPQLFTQNERLVFRFTKEGQGLYDLVMVGALNVGKITSPFWPEHTTNQLGGSKQVNVYPVNACVQAGDELGTFHLGSTVVVCWSRAIVEGYRLRSEKGAFREVRMGQAM